MAAKIIEENRKELTELFKSNEEMFVDKIMRIDEKIDATEVIVHELRETLGLLVDKVEHKFHADEEENVKRDRRWTLVFRATGFISGAVVVKIIQVIIENFPDIIAFTEKVN